MPNSTSKSCLRPVGNGVSYFSPVIISYSSLQGPPWTRITGKMSTGKVMTKRRINEKSDENETNLNLNIVFLPPTLIGKRPVQNRKLTAKMKKYLKQPETCSNPARFSEAGFTFLVFILSSCLLVFLLCKTSTMSCSNKCTMNMLAFLLPTGVYSCLSIYNKDNNALQPNIGNTHYQYTNLMQYN